MHDGELVGGGVSLDEVGTANDVKEKDPWVLSSRGRVLGIQTCGA